MNEIEKWFYKRMLKELIKMRTTHQTNSIGYIVGLLQHDIERN